MKIQNGGPDPFDEMCVAKCFIKKTSGPSLKWSGNLEGKVKCRQDKESEKKGLTYNSSRSGRRLCDARTSRVYYGDKQQICREVLRTRSKGTQHGGSKLVWLVSSHVQEETHARSEAALGVSAENEKMCQKIYRSWHKMRTKDCERPRKIQNVQVDNGVVVVISVSSDSDVVPCLASPDSPARDIPLTETECMCVPRGPQR